MAKKKISYVLVSDILCLKPYSGEVFLWSVKLDNTTQVLAEITQCYLVYVHSQVSILPR